MAVSSSSLSSPSSSPDRKRRHSGRDKGTSKMRRKHKHQTKRRRRHDSLSSSYSSYSSDSSSESDYSQRLKVSNWLTGPSQYSTGGSLDSEDEVSGRSRKHKSSSRSKKDKERSKRHRHKHSKSKMKEKAQEERCSSPVQLSKFLGREKDDGVRRSAVSGKKILLKVEKSKEDKEAETKRNELLKFLNASYD